MNCILILKRYVFFFVFPLSPFGAVKMLQLSTLMVLAGFWLTNFSLFNFKIIRWIVNSFFSTSCLDFIQTDQGISWSKDLDTRFSNKNCMYNLFIILSWNIIVPITIINYSNASEERFLLKWIFLWKVCINKCKYEFLS